MEQKKNFLKTGGGTPDKAYEDPEVEEILALIAGDLTPLKNPFDSDGRKSKVVFLLYHNNRLLMSHIMYLLCTYIFYVFSSTSLQQI